MSDETLNNETVEEQVHTETLETEATLETPAAEQPQAEAANEWQQRYLHLAADFENYKKRTLRERDLAAETAREALLKALLPTVDNLARAIKLAETAQDIAVLQEGLASTSRKLLADLGRQGVRPIETVGKVFDSELHEAIAKMPDPAGAAATGHVWQEVESGWYYQDKVLKAAKVIIAE